MALTRGQVKDKIATDFILNCTDAASVQDKESLAGFLFQAAIGNETSARANYDRIALLEGCDHEKAEKIIESFQDWLEDIIAE